MAVRVAINGFGRIGRMVLRAALEAKRKDLIFCAINDLGDPQTLAHLLRQDSVHGPLPFPVGATDSGLRVKGRTIPVFHEASPETLPWKKLNVEVVLECTGRFTSGADAHISAGAQRVLVSAPAEADITVVYGVNHKSLRKTHRIVSNASCTTNCLAPVVSVLEKLCGIEMGYMTTIHAYTGDQRPLDALHTDPRRSRAAALSMIPTSTGAARAISLVMPQLAGRLDGSAVRVPTPNVSLVDFVFVPQRKVGDASLIHNAMKTAARGPLKGVLAVCDAPLVSVDFNHDPHSSILDMTQTQIVNGGMIRLVSWYDNEWGFANRMCDVAAFMGKQGGA